MILKTVLNLEKPFNLNVEENALAFSRSLYDYVYVQR
jgi:hypothetical protein